MSSKGKVEIALEFDDSGAFKTMTVLDRNLDNAAKSADKLGKSGLASMSNLQAGAAAAGIAIGALTTAITTAAYEVWNISKETADYGDELAKMSSRLGISVEFLAELRYSSQLAGTNLEKVGTGLRQLAKNAQDMARGTGEAKVAFEDLGISIRESDGTLKGQRTLLLEIADRFAKMEDGGRKTADAMRIFGESGTDLIPLLNQGRTGLEQMAEEAKNFGLILDEQAVKQAEAFNDNLTRLDNMMLGFKLRIGNDLLPILNDMGAAFLQNKEFLDLLQDSARLTALSIIQIAKAGTYVLEFGGGFSSGLASTPLGQLLGIGDTGTSSEWSADAQKIRARLEEAFAQIALGFPVTGSASPIPRTQSGGPGGGGLIPVKTKFGVVYVPAQGGPGSLFGENGWGSGSPRDISGPYSPDLGNMNVIPPGGPVGAGGTPGLGIMVPDQSTLESGISSMKTFESGMGDILGNLSDKFGLYQQALQGAGDAMYQFATGQAALGEAFKRLGVEVIATLARQAMIKSMYELAEGLAAIFLHPALAAGHFKAAAAYGAVAAAAGVASRGMSGGGMGPSGSAFNPVTTRDSAFTIDMSSRARQNETNVKLMQTISRLEAKIQTMKPGDVVAAGTARGITEFTQRGDYAQMGARVWDEPLVQR